MDNGYLKVDGNMPFTPVGGKTLVLSNHSMIQATNYIQDRGFDVIGYGSLNEIKITNEARIINWPENLALIDGSIEMTTPNGTLVEGNYPENFINGATLTSTANAQNYIPTSPCNPEGIGSAAITDTDSDGVADNLDDYPTDASRVYNNWYPNEKTWGSLAYEDLWPS